MGLKVVHEKSGQGVVSQPFDIVHGFNGFQNMRKVIKYYNLITSHINKANKQQNKLY